MWLKLGTFLLWVGVGASALVWAMPWLKPAGGNSPPPALAADPGVPAADWSPLLARSPAQPTAAPVATDASRFRLVGVAGPLRASGQGVALLSVDGQPPRAVRTGEPVDGQRVVLEVSAHMVKIGLPGAAPSLTLQAPLLPPPTTGVPAGAVAQ